jgi:hypothetical protein
VPSAAHSLRVPWLPVCVRCTSGSICSSICYTCKYLQILQILPWDSPVFAVFAGANTRYLQGNPSICSAPPGSSARNGRIACKPSLVLSRRTFRPFYALRTAQPSRAPLPSLARPHDITCTSRFCMYEHLTTTAEQLHTHAQLYLCESGHGRPAEPRATDGRLAYGRLARTRHQPASPHAAGGARQAARRRRARRRRVTGGARQPRHPQREKRGGDSSDDDLEGQDDRADEG